MKQKSGPGKAPAEQVLKDIRRQTRRQYSAEEKMRIGVQNWPLIDKVWQHSEGKGSRGRTVTLKVKFSDFECK